MCWGTPTPVFCKKRLDLLDCKGVDFFEEGKERQKRRQAAENIGFATETRRTQRSQVSDGNIRRVTSPRFCMGNKSLDSPTPQEHDGGSYISVGGIFRVAFASRHGRYFAVVIRVLDAFIDESSDQERKDVFCVAGIVAHENFWKPLEHRWTKRLSADGVKYFSAKECKAVQGPFRHLIK